MSWRNGAGQDCKVRCWELSGRLLTPTQLIGPASLCECGHRYGEHESDALASAARGGGGERAREPDLRCLSARCRCARFAYLPSAGTWRARCGCKHESAAHDATTRACGRCACACFGATFGCACGEGWGAHATAVETRAQRAARGAPVDNLGGGGEEYAALGGLTSFSSLLIAEERGEVRAEPEIGPAAPPLARLKAARAAARASAAAAAPEAEGDAGSYAARRLRDARRASEAAAARRAAEAEAAKEAIGRLSELDQLYRLSQRRGRT